jgi:thioredoxin reductase
VPYDCIVVGAGPAGLSGALMLGRCRRSVLLCYAGEPRNARSLGLHGYLTRDGIAPSEFIRLALEEIEHYTTVELRHAEIVEAKRTSSGFTVVSAGGLKLSARKLLLATGVVDELPDIEGLQALYGTSVHHCPYCDGWQWRDQPLAIYGRSEDGVALALGLTVWSDDLVLCTDGPAGLSEEQEEQLARAGIEVREERVVGLKGRNGMLEEVLFEDGEPLPRRALFVCAGQHQRSNLAAKLGCSFNAKGAVDTGASEATNVPGLYVAGDSSKEAQSIIVAAAEGAEAGMAINKALLKEDLRTRTRLPAAPTGAARTQRGAE